MKIFLRIIVIILSAAGAFAQNETNEWIFGENCYVSFAGCTPVVKERVPLVTAEGSASMSDKEGNLLFYTNGDKIWNRYHQVMPNGKDLNGGVSSAQCAIALPHPGRKNVYYLFTAADLTSKKMKKGFHYSIVNMELDDGRGDIEQKNVILSSDSTSEAVSATFDETGNGYWVVTHHQTSNLFYSYHVTADGVNSFPVVSRISDEIANFSITQIKISPNSKLLAFTNAFAGLVLLKFDNKTGIISDPQSLIGEGAYGASFSPDNSRLYTTYYNLDLSETPYSIAQFTVNLSNHADILTSKTFLKRPGGYPYLGGMQLAPDGKIYVNEGEYLGVIDKPNEAGLASTYLNQVVNLGNRMAINGLPNFPDCYFANNNRQPCLEPISGFKTQPVCAGNTMQYIDTSIRAEEWFWEFPGGQPNTFKGQFPPPVYYENGGTFLTKLTTKNEHGEHVLEQSVVVWERPGVAIQKPENSPEFTICRGTNIQLHANATGDVRYQWRTTDAGLNNYTIAAPVAQPDITTTYHVAVFSKQGDCMAEDSVTVTIKENEYITARLITAQDVIDLSNPGRVQVHITSQGVGNGVFSFKGSVNFDKTVFQYRAGSIAAIRGFDNSWVLKAEETARGFVEIEGSGSTPVFDALLKMDIDAYLGDQENNFISLQIDSINRESVLKGQDCKIFDIEQDNQKQFLLGDVCGGSLRYVNLSPFKNSLGAVNPNPVENESTIEYSIAFDGNAKIELFTPDGNLLKTPVDNFHKAGKYSYILFAKDFPRGVYHCRLTTDQYSETRSFVVIR